MRAEGNGGKLAEQTPSWGSQFWNGPDFRASLKVQAMDWAEQGMYRHLLDLAWENEGIPADVDELRGILKLDAAAFRRAWKKIGRCFDSKQSDPTKLVNSRQEKERAIRAEARAKRSRAGCDGNRARWGSRNGRSSVADGSHCDRIAIPEGSQTDRLPSVLSSLPSGPSDPGVRTEPSRSSDGRALEQRDDGAASSRPAGREGPSSSEAELFAALRLTTFREHAVHREAELMEAAEDLAADGATVRDVVRLAKRAFTKAGVRDPDGMFAHWIKNRDERRKELSKR